MTHRWAIHETAPQRLRLLSTWKFIQQLTPQFHQYVGLKQFQRFWKVLLPPDGYRPTWVDFLKHLKLYFWQFVLHHIRKSDEMSKSLQRDNNLPYLHEINYCLGGLLVFDFDGDHLLSEHVVLLDVVLFLFQRFGWSNFRIIARNAYVFSFHLSISLKTRNHFCFCRSHPLRFAVSFFPQSFFLKIAEPKQPKHHENMRTDTTSKHSYLFNPCIFNLLKQFSGEKTLYGHLSASQPEDCSISLNSKDVCNLDENPELHDFQNIHHLQDIHHFQ